MRQKIDKELVERLAHTHGVYGLTNLLNEVGINYGIISTDFSVEQIQKLSHPYIETEDFRYYQFSIPKKSGGERTINAPYTTLKTVQRCLMILLNSLYNPTYNTHGFVIGRSVVTNAKPHIKKPDVFNTDISDFFPSITMPQIIGCLSGFPYNLDKELATIIARLCCIGHKDEYGRIRFVLPQGAPTSPVMSNIICRGMDLKLATICGGRFTYTRYADDITFSGNIGKLRKRLEYKVQHILAHYHFKMNKSKTRCQHFTQCQEVTGIIVNKKANTRREYIREIRQLLYIWEQYGYEELVHKLFSQNNDTSHADPKNILLGKLNYLKMVKGDTNQYRTLLNQYEHLCNRTDVALYNFAIAKFKRCVRICCRKAPIYSWFITLNSKCKTCRITYISQINNSNNNDEYHIPLNCIYTDDTKQEYSLIFLNSYRTFIKTGNMDEFIKTLKQWSIIGGNNTCKRRF